MCHTAILMRTYSPLAVTSLNRTRRANLPLAEPALMKTAGPLMMRKNGVGLGRWMRMREMRETRVRNPQPTVVLPRNLKQVIPSSARALFRYSPIMIGTAYIPPHLRNRPRDEADSELMVKLTRQLKGLLNRLGNWPPLLPPLFDCFDPG